MSTERVNEMRKSLEDAIRKSHLWDDLSYNEKSEKLFLNQKQMLDMFLERNAISQRDYQKSLHDLALKTGHGSLFAD